MTLPQSSRSQGFIMFQNYSFCSVIKKIYRTQHFCWQFIIRLLFNLTFLLKKSNSSGGSQKIRLLLKIHYEATFWSSLIGTSGNIYIVQNARLVAILTTKSHQISLNLTEPHQLLPNLTITISHQIPQNLTKYTKTQQISPQVTQSH